MLTAGQDHLLCAVIEGCLVKYIDDVTTKARNSFFKPETHDVFDFIKDSRVMIIEIRLFFGKKMQIVFAAQFIVFPAFLCKKTGPVIRRTAICSGPPDIVAAIWTIWITTFPEPFMLIRSMVDNQIHYHFDIQAAGMRNELFHILHCTEFRLYTAIVANVITIVIIRRTIYRGEPQNTHTQFLKFIEMGYDSRNISDTITVRVLKASGVDLIYDLSLIHI